MFIISKMNYNYFRLLAWPMLIVVTGLLVLVLLLPASFGDFHRWINIGALSIQPSELAKVAIVIFCAYKMEQEHEKLRVSTKAMWKYLILTLVYAGLVFAENHVSGAILVGALGVVMMFLGGVKMRWFAIGGALAIAAVTLVILKPDILPGHASVRIVAWLDKSYEPTGARWQTNQSLYAIGSGGLMGAGLGQSKQKHLYVSEPQNDFILPSSVRNSALSVLWRSFCCLRCLFGVDLWWQCVRRTVWQPDGDGAHLPDRASGGVEYLCRNRYASKHWN